MAVKERTCICCGTKYSYCPTCAGYDPNQTWKFIAHDEKCFEVFNAWQSYRGNEISKEEAAKIFKALNVENIIKADTAVGKGIKEILATTEKKEEPKPEVKETKEPEKHAKAASEFKGGQKK